MATASLPPIETASEFAWPAPRPLLAAEWLNLAMVNYEVDPQVLAPLVPAGVELDYWQDKTYLSIVGFQFRNTRLFGVRFPFHAHFEEVNLRFYVRREAAEGWRRGVVFVRELAPRFAVTLLANVLYGEKYLCVPMRHRLEHAGGEVPRRVEYSWKFRRQWRHVAVEPGGEAHQPAADSHEEFITEHYWGYATQRNGRAKEYLVAHPRWRISRAARVEFSCDVAGLYGERFAPFLQGEPASAFWVDGSAVRVYPGCVL